MKTSTKLIKIAIKLANNSQTLQALLDATKENKAIQFQYLSITNNTVKKYTVLPLQIKLRKLQNGSQTGLYAEDVNKNNRTKSFVLKNIKNIKLIDNIFKRNRKNKLQNYVK